MHDLWQKPVFDALFDDGLASGGALVVRLGAGGEVVGSSRYGPLVPADGGEIEIGWSWLARTLWGGSCNAEMKRLMLAHALASVERVVFRVGETNWRSRRAMEKIGGQLTDRREVFATPHGDVVHVVFEIDRAGFADGPLMRDSA